MEYESVERLSSEALSAPPTRAQHRRRGIFLLPGLFTVGNLFCGYYSILATLLGRPEDLDHAALAIGFAFVFDGIDGRVARLTKTNSAFGKEFDSLADVVSFGIAPAFLAYAWGVRGLAASDLAQIFHLHQLGWLISFLFVVCCAWRLARFNIHGMAPGGSRYFVGLPTPMAGCMIAATVYAASSPVQSSLISVCFLVLVFALAVLMTSTVRYYSFKDVGWGKRQSSLAVVLIALLFGAIFAYSRILLVTLASVYVLHGPALHVVRNLRRRPAAHSS